jgi:two-component system, response regulator RegA
MANNDKQSVLIVDDDDIYRQTLCRAFRLRGWEAYEAADAALALAAAQEFGPNLAVVDLRLTGESGLEIVRALRGLDATLTIIMLTGYGSIATALEAVKCGADDYLGKPVDVDQIIAAYEGGGGGSGSTGERPQISAPSLGRVEWEHIQRVLSDCGGNVSQAAKALGLHRRSLQRKLSKYPPRD